MRKKRFPVGKAILLIFCLLLVSLAAAAAVCVGLAFTDHNSDRYTLESTDDSFPFDVLRGALTGSRFEVTEDKVNTYLNRFFCRRVQTGDEEPVLENIRLYFHEESDTELYARVYFRQHHFSVYAQISVVQEGADGEAAVQFRHVKLGELPLPDWVVDRIISGMTDGKPYLRYENSMLYVQTRFEYNLGSLHFTLHLNTLHPKEGAVVCRTNHLSWELIRSVYEFLTSDEGRELAGRLFGSQVEGWKNHLFEALSG